MKNPITQLTDAQFYSLVLMIVTTERAVNFELRTSTVIHLDLWLKGKRPADHYFTDEQLKALHFNGFMTSVYSRARDGMLPISSELDPIKITEVPQEHS